MKDIKQHGPKLQEKQHELLSGFCPLQNYKNQNINMERHVQIESKASLLSAESKKMSRTRKRQATHVNIDETTKEFGSANRSKIKYN